jgi:hypothetical protein
MHGEQSVEIFEAESLEVAEAEIAGVGDDGVDPAEMVERGSSDAARAIGRRHRIVTGERSAAGGADLCYYGVGETWRGFRAHAAHRISEIVHDHAAAAARDFLSIGSA